MNDANSRFTPSTLAAGTGNLSKLARAAFVFDPNTIVKGVSSGVVKSFVFEGSNDVGDPTDQVSYLGTPVFSNLIFEPNPVSGKTGTFTDIDGNDQTFEGLRIDTVLFQVQRAKNIVKTAVQGKNGTRKEYTSDGDFEVTINGAIMSENPNTYPELDVKKIHQINVDPRRDRSDV